MTFKVLVVLLVLMPLTTAHSWMSCPLSFNPEAARGGDTNGPCESYFGQRPVTSVQAGDKLKVGWVSNNHAGGFVRLALVPESQQADRAAYKKNVLKVACYGHDTRPGKTKYGDCYHPCDGRPGCEWQQTQSDRERYDTTVTIPTNLKDGRYILQWVAIVGNGVSPYYSCSLLDIRGGSSGLSCGRSNKPSAPPCFVSAGPGADLLIGDASLGDFCFSPNSLGDVDDNMTKRPVNAACDPRTSCSLSVNPVLCGAELSGIANPNNPMQAKCAANPSPPSPPIATTTTASATITNTPVALTTIKNVPPTTTSKPSPTKTQTTTKKPTTTPTPPTQPGNIVANSPCDRENEFDCAGSSALARCVFGKWVTWTCAPGTSCKEILPKYYICA